MLSVLPLWSMKTGSGAPSFYKTIEAYLFDGWKITLIAPSSTNLPIEFIGKVKLVNFHFFRNPFSKIPGLRIIFRLILAKYSECMFYFLGNKLLKDNIGKNLIYAYEVHAVKAGKSLSRKYNIPLISRFQGTVLTSVKSSFINRLLRYPHFSALSTTSDIVIMTDDGTMGDKVLKRLGNKSNNIYFWKNGVEFLDKSKNKKIEKIEELRTKYGINPEDKVLLTISRLVNWKRVDRSIIALSKVIKTEPRCKLVILGEGSEKENLIALSENLKVSDHVIFIGAVKHEEIWNYLNLADIFLSLYDLSNLGNPLFEAMICGKPIITLDVGNTSSIIKNNKNGVLLQVYELSELPSRILYCLSNIDFANELGKQANDFAMRNFWDWKTRLSTEVKIVNDLVQ